MDLLTPLEVKQHWPHLSELLGRAIKYNRGEMAVEDIPELVDRGQMAVVVWRSEGRIDLALAFELKVLPRKRLLNVAYAGGRGLKRLFEDRDQLLAIANKLQADAVECSVRPAMAELLSRIGPVAQYQYTVLEWTVAAN